MTHTPKTSKFQVTKLVPPNEYARIPHFCFKQDTTIPSAARRTEVQATQRYFEHNPSCVSREDAHGLAWVAV